MGLAKLHPDTLNTEKEKNISIYSKLFLIIDYRFIKVLLYCRRDVTAPVAAPRGGGGGGARRGQHWGAARHEPLPQPQAQEEEGRLPGKQRRWVSALSPR